MPYKSNAQRRYFHAAEERGDISASTVEEFDKASKGKKLPERVGKKTPSRRKVSEFGSHFGVHKFRLTK